MDLFDEPWAGTEELRSAIHDGYLEGRQRMRRYEKTSFIAEAPSLEMYIAVAFQARPSQAM